MPQLPDLWSTNMSPVGVQFEADLAGLGPITRTFPEGTSIWCRETRKLYTWDPQSVAGTMFGVSVAVSTGGAFIATGGPSAIPSLDVLAFGADPSGIQDSTTAFRNTITAAGALFAAGANGVDIALPRGNYLITDEITIALSRIRIYGEGVWATQITFNPTVAGKVLFKYVSGAEIFENTLERMTITTSNGVRKIAIRLVDTSEQRIRDIHVSQFFTSGWAAVGDSSIAIQSQGRELTEITRCTLQANRPISIEKNPNSTLSCDHLVLNSVYLLAGTTSDACISVANDVETFTNFTMTGTNPWVGGKYGFFWDAGLQAITALNVNFSNIRWEQQTGTAGYAIFFNRNGINISCQNVAAGALANGFYFRIVSELTLGNCTFERAGGVALDIDNSSDKVLINNFIGQSGSAFNSGTLVAVFKTFTFGTSVPSHAYYSTTGATQKELEFESGISGNPLNIWSSFAGGGHKLLKVIDFGGAGTRTQVDSNGLDFQLLGPAGSNLFFSSTGIAQLTGASVVSSVEVITGGFIGIEQGNPTGSGIVSALNTRTALTLARMPANTGDGVTYIANATVNPSANATGGGILYCTAGALTYRGSGGTVTTLGAA